jgi:hypothetical protein
LDRVIPEMFDPVGRDAARMATMTDLARCSVELDAIRDAMAALAPSRLADTSAWVQTSWALAQAEGALRRAASGWWMAPPSVEELAGRVRSAWTALRDLESLGQGPPPWPARAARDESRHRAPAAPEQRRAPDGDG